MNSELRPYDFNFSTDDPWSLTLTGDCTIWPMKSVEVASLHLFLFFSGVFKKVGVIKGSVECSARYLFTGLSQFGYLIYFVFFILYINVTFIQKGLIPM